MLRLCVFVLLSWLRFCVTASAYVLLCRCLGFDSGVNVSLLFFMFVLSWLRLCVNALANFDVCVCVLGFVFV